MTTENEKPPLPPKTEDSAARIAKALAALQETDDKSSPPTPRVAEVPTEPEKPGGAIPPAPATEEAPEVRIARGLVERQIKTALGEHVVDLRATELLLADAGASLGLGDDGSPAIQTKDGKELPVTFESLKEAGVPESLLKSRGRPGSGLVEQGSPQPQADIVARGMDDQAFFERNRPAIMRELERRKTGGTA